MIGFCVVSELVLLMLVREGFILPLIVLSTANGEVVFPMPNVEVLLLRRPFGVEVE